MVVVQISEVRLVGSVLAAPFYAPVVLAPFGTELLPFAPCLLYGVVPVACTEHLPQVFRHFALVPVAHIAYDVAFQMGGASLQLSAGEHLADDILQALETVRTDKAYLPDTTLIKVVQHLAPAQGTLRRLVEDSKHFPCLVLPHRQDYVECLSVHAPLPVDLDVHAVVNGNDKCTDFGNRECSDFGNSNAPISVTTIHNFR